VTFNCNSQWVTATANPTENPCTFSFEAMGEFTPNSFFWTTNFGVFPGNEILITFPQAGTYQVTFTGIVGTTNVTCIGTVVVTENCNNEPPEPDIEMTPFIDCCQLIFGMTSDVPTVMTWQIISQADQVLFSNTSGVALQNWNANIFNVVVCDPDDRVRILSNGVVVNTIDLSDFLIEGRWVGGDLFVCDNTTFTEAIGIGLLPPTTFNGNLSCSPNLFFNGTVIQDRPIYAINNANVCMGQGSRFQIGNGQTQVDFTTSRSTYQGDDACGQMWWGIEVIDNSNATLTQQTIIRDAMYGLRIENYNANDNDINITVRNSRFENNFIGFRATGGNYFLREFQGNTFSRNFGRDLKNLFPTTPCPTVNDLADAETPIQWQRDFFFNTGGGICWRLY
jgi:hypothetical protein